VIKLKDILNEEKSYKSGKLFVMKSPHSPKHMPYDHIGFITDDGEIIDMSGHRYTEDGKEPLPPKKYKYEDTEELFKMPKNKEEAEKKGLYKEIPLPKNVTIPSTIACDVKTKNKAQNCGSFVKIVLSNNGIETTKSHDMTDIAAAVANKTEAGKKSFKDPRKKNEPAKPKTKKKAKTDGWWNKAGDTTKNAYIKKYGGAPNESMIKLKNILKESIFYLLLERGFLSTYPSRVQIEAWATFGKTFYENNYKKARSKSDLDKVRKKLEGIWRFNKHWPKAKKAIQYFYDFTTDELGIK
jgi:HEPN domain-containing protein